jgi:hypothetical protein
VVENPFSSDPASGVEGMFVVVWFGKAKMKISQQVVED